MQRQFVPGAVLQTMQDERVTAAMMVPTMISFLLDVPDLERYDLGALAWIMVGGAPMSPANAGRMMERLGCRYVLRVRPHRNHAALDGGQPQEHAGRRTRGGSDELHHPHGPGGAGRGSPRGGPRRQ